MDEIQRVGLLVGGPQAKQWAAELRAVAAKLEEGSQWGPKHARWNLEAARLKLAADIAEHGYRRRVALEKAQTLSAQLPVLAGKAVDDADALEVGMLALELQAAVNEEVEQVRLNPRTRRPLGGKVLAAGTDLEQELRTLRGLRTGGLDRELAAPEGLL